jgi:hypothetical protein
MGLSDAAEPSHGSPELPSDYREFRRSYRWLLLYGPWALAVIGLALIGIGLFADRPGEVSLAAIGFGAAMFIAGVLLPRMRGLVELGPSGVKGAVEGLPQAFMLVAVAREAAEQAIPADEPDKERRVNEVVGLTVEGLADKDWYHEAVENIYAQATLGIPSAMRVARMEAIRRQADQAAARRREEASKEANPPADQQDS